MKAIILFLFAIIISALLPGCAGHHTEAWEKLDSAEALLESNPDSARSIISSIQVSSRSGREECARYALINTAAIDRCGIDTTDLKILQPAIDYYPDHGTPDQRLRTLYYQGRIFQNRIDYAKAMDIFIEAREIPDITDSLTYARLLVAQGALYYKQYKAEEYIQNRLSAAHLYALYGKHIEEADCYAGALAGNIYLENKLGADSILNICTELNKKFPETVYTTLPSIISYTLDYGSDLEIRNLLQKTITQNLPRNTEFEVARAYTVLNQGDAALACLDKIKVNKDSMKYLLIRADALECSGNYKDALYAYKEYLGIAEAYNDDLYNNGLLFSEEKHKLEMEALSNIEKKNRVIWISISGILVLLLFAGGLYYLYYRNKSKRELAEQQNLNLITERENLQFQLATLEEERLNLVDTIKNFKTIKPAVEKVLKARLNLLNGLLASEITENSTHSIPYKKWIETIKKDKDSFISSTQAALQASNPVFMQYLNDCHLTDEEIKFACLFAIGLRGKEVGEYLQLKRHYNTSSVIRQKLGIDEHQTNLGPYIRSLMDKMG